MSSNYSEEDETTAVLQPSFEGISCFGEYFQMQTTNAQSLMDCTGKKQRPTLTERLKVEGPAWLQDSYKARLGSSSTGRETGWRDEGVKAGEPETQGI